MKTTFSFISIQLSKCKTCWVWKHQLFLLHSKLIYHFPMTFGVELQCTLYSPPSTPQTHPWTNIPVPIKHHGPPKMFSAMSPATFWRDLLMYLFLAKLILSRMCLTELSMSNEMSLEFFLKSLKMFQMKMM